MYPANPHHPENNGSDYIWPKRTIQMKRRLQHAGMASTPARAPSPPDQVGFLHFYHYNELQSSDYHYYDATYIYTIREKFDLQIYHI